MTAFSFYEALVIFLPPSEKFTAEPAVKTMRFQGCVVGNCHKGSERMIRKVLLVSYRKGNC